MAEVSSEYWSYDDPRWANDPAYGNPETMKYVGPWEQVLQATGFRGKVYEPMIEMQPDPNGGFMPQEVGQQYTPQAKAAIDSLRASGYDLRWKHPDKRTFNTYYGLVTPSGEVEDIKIAGSDLGDAIMPMIKVFGAGLGLAGLGAGVNSLLGGAGAGAGAGAGSALGIAEAMAPGVLAPATAAEMAGVNALLGGGTGALTAADLANLSPDVLGQSSRFAQNKIANFSPLSDGTVTNVVTPGAQAPGAASTNALAPGPYQNLTPTELLQLDYATTPGLNMSPMPGTTGTLSQLQPIPASTAVTGAPPTFQFSTLQDPTAAITSTPPSVGTIADLAGIPADAGFAAGMGVDAGMNALNLGAGAGAVKNVADVAATGATTGATGATTGAGMDSATRAALYGSEGYGAGMTGAQTSAYDTVLGATGSKTAADIASTVTGAGGSLLDKAVQLVTSPVGQAVVGGVGSVVGGVLEANAAEKAAQTQADAAANALKLQRDMFDYQKSLLEPYRAAGTKALERLSGAMGLGGQGSQQQMLEMDPGYGFRLGEGLKALERMQASRGNFLSGGAMKAGQRFAQDTASQEYDRAFGRLSDIAGIGRSTSTQMGNAASGFGTSAGNIMGQEANALAAGRMGRASAYTGAVGGVLNSFQNYLNRQQEERLVRDIFGRTTVGG
jgi:hypothetical protein